MHEWHELVVTRILTLSFSLSSARHGATVCGDVYRQPWRYAAVASRAGLCAVADGWRCVFADAYAPLPAAHRTTPGPIDYKVVYEAQLGLEEVKRRRLPASSLPKLSDFLFTFEVIEVVEVNPARGYYRGEEFQVVRAREVEEKVVGSWTGVFEDWDRYGSSSNALITNAFNWTDDRVLQYLQDVTRPGFTEEDYDRIPERAHPELKCRCILTLRSDITRTAVIYDAKLDESACAKLDPDGIFEFENSFSKPRRRLLYDWDPDGGREDSGLLCDGSFCFSHLEEGHPHRRPDGTNSSFWLMILSGNYADLSHHNALNSLMSFLPQGSVNRIADAGASRSRA